jgi:hypothetical protein
MKTSKTVLALILFLLAYGVLFTVHTVRLEKRLSRLEASHHELESHYRVLSNTLAHVQMTPELSKALSEAMAKEGSRPAFSRDLRLSGSELNSVPARGSTR